MTLFEGNLPQTDRERETERERERARLQEIGDHRLNFPHRFCPLCECAQQYLLGLRQV